MTTHGPSRHRAERRLDLPSLALLLLGLIFGIVAYILITEQRSNPMVLVPAVIAAALGASHLFKHQAPRDHRRH